MAAPLCSESLFPLLVFHAAPVLWASGAISRAPRGPGYLGVPCHSGSLANTPHSGSPVPPPRSVSLVAPWEHSATPLLRERCATLGATLQLGTSGASETLSQSGCRSGSHLELTWKWEPWPRPCSPGVRFHSGNPVPLWDPWARRHALALRSRSPVLLRKPHASASSGSHVPLREPHSTPELREP